MAKQGINPLPAPVTRALVFVCDRCGKRAGDSKRLSGELASHVKRKAKQRWGKGEVRVALTSCMDACPENGISVSIQPLTGSQASVLIAANIHDIDGASDALLRLVRTMTDP
jgi:predicted metal-binding protein